MYYIAKVFPAGTPAVSYAVIAIEVSSKQSEKRLPIFSLPLLHVYVNPRNLPCNPALINTRSATDHSRDLRQTKVLQKIKIIDQNWYCTIAYSGLLLFALRSFNIDPIKNTTLIVNDINFLVRWYRQDDSYISTFYD